MRRILSVVCATAIAAGVLPALATSAEALEAPVAFTSANLPTWQTNGVAWSVAQAQGLVFVGGTFTQIRPPGAASGAASSLTRNNLAVLDAATGSPTSCAPSITGPAGLTVRSLNVSPDGKTLYIGGYFTSVAGVAVNHLAALDIASCSVITSFKPSPNGTVRTINSTDTAVYFGGSLVTVKGTARGHAAEVTAVGTATPGALLPWAPLFSGEVRAIALKPDHSVAVVGGDFDQMNGADSHALGVVTADTGTTVKNYPVGFIAPTSVVKDLAVDDTGFYTANEGTGGGVFDGRIALDWSSLDQRWRDTCLGATQAVVVYKGILYSGSHAHDCSSMGEFPDGQRNHFLAEPVNDPTLLPWFPNTNEGPAGTEQIGPRDMVVAHTASMDYMYATGEFTTVNGAAQQGITRFGQGPDTVAPSAPTPSLNSLKQGQVLVAWRSSLDTDDADLTYRVYRDGGSTPIATKTGKSFFWIRPQLSFVDTGLTPGSVHSYRISASDGTNTTTSAARNVTVSSATSTYASRIVADGANLFWRYDEPGDVFIADSSGSDTNGTLRGGATYQVTPAAIGGDPSRAITLNGTTANISTDERFDNPQTYSLETWIKTGTTQGGKIVGFGDKQTGNSGNYDRQIYMTNDGRIVFGVWIGSAATIYSPTALNDNTWHHVVATQGSHGMSLYVDGVRVGHNGVTTNQPYSGYWRIGGDNLNGWPDIPTSTFWAGSLDETAIYPTALTTAQAQAHFTLAGGSVTGPTLPTDVYGQSVVADDPDFFWRLGEATGPTAADASGENEPGTYGTGVTYGQPGAVAGTTDTAVTLDGTGNGLVSAQSQQPSPTTFSVEAWFNTTSTQGGKLIGFGTNATGDSSGYDKHVYLTNDGHVIFGVYTGATNIVTSPGTYRDGHWHHVVATQDGAGMKLYLDGALVGSDPQTANQSYNGYWRVGGDNLNGWPSQPASEDLAGTVDEVAVYTGALSADRVLAHYQAGNPPAADVVPPSTPADLTIGVSAGNPQLSWTASTDDTAVTGYNVYRASDAATLPSAATYIGSTSGTTYTDSAATVGTWYYRVVARDAASNYSDPTDAVSVTVADTVAPSAPGSLTVAGSATAESLSWTASTDNVGVVEYDVYRSSNPGVTIDAGNFVAVVTGATSYSDAPGNGTWYYRVVARDAASNVSAPSNEAHALVGDVTPPSQPVGVVATPSGSTVNVTWGTSTDDVAVTGYDVYRSGAANTAPVDANKVGTSSDGTFSESSVPNGTWYYRVVAKDAAGNRSVASGDGAVTVGPPPDTTPPSTPTGVAATVSNVTASGGTVALTWTASTDNTAVTGYDVYRSSTSGAAPVDANKVGSPSGASFTETSVPLGTWYYRVVAKDAATNRSGASTEVKVVLSLGGSTVTLTPTADTYANQGAPTTNYGNEASLASRGTSGYTAYLRFVLPAAPAGTSLTGAVLKIRTTTDSFAGSTDTHSVSLASDTWTETTLTWNNRPTVSATTLGSLTGVTAPNTAYQATLSASGLASSLASQVTIAVRDTGTDNLWFWSRTYGTAASRPQLVLTFS